MKTVLLLRHAKSSWDKPGLPDHLRPLAPRGRRAAPLVGTHMVQNELVPERVLCSSARRAIETWKLVSEAMADTIHLEVRDDLYGASPGGILALLQELPEEEEMVLVVGHNPTFEDLTVVLSGDGREGTLLEVSRKFPTGALAVIDFSVDSWSEVEGGAGYLRDFVRPRSLES